MIKSFLRHIESEHLFKIDDRILLAVSGGRDSMFMLHLFKEVGLKFGVAHFNHTTRYGESDRDEQFVREFCKKNNIEFYSIKIDINAAIQSGKENNFHDVARNYRYSWLENIRKDHCFDYIATAHNQDDNIETFVYKISKGSGIKGLKGIKEKNGNVIRPILHFSRNDIDKFINENEIDFVEDSSNAQDKYDRNYIRHNIIPTFRNLNADFDKRIGTTIENIAATDELFEFLLVQFSKNGIIHETEKTIINTELLFKYSRPADLLFALISNYGFNITQCNNIIYGIRNTGNIFYSEYHTLIIDRGSLLVIPKREDREFNIKIDQPGDYTVNGKNISLSIFDANEFIIPKGEQNTNYIDAEKVSFPLIIRNKKSSDSFKAFGLKGKTTSLKKYFIDKKISRNEKDELLIFESVNEIIMIAGLDISWKARITYQTKKILKIFISD